MAISGWKFLYGSKRDIQSCHVSANCEIEQLQMFPPTIKWHYETYKSNSISSWKPYFQLCCISIKFMVSSNLWQFEVGSFCMDPKRIYNVVMFQETLKLGSFRCSHQLLNDTMGHTNQIQYYLERIFPTVLNFY